jgi:hypothetical protein
LPLSKTLSAEVMYLFLVCVIFAMCSAHSNPLKWYTYVLFSVVQPVASRYTDYQSKLFCVLLIRRLNSGRRVWFYLRITNTDKIPDSVIQTSTGSKFSKPRVITRHGRMHENIRKVRAVMTHIIYVQYYFRLKIGY